MAGSRCHNTAMIARVGVHQHGLRLNCRQHLFNIAIKQLRIELELLCVAVCELLIRFDDTDDLDIAALQDGTEKTGNMPVHQSDDGDA